MLKHLKLQAQSKTFLIVVYKKIYYIISHFLATSSTPSYLYTLSKHSGISCELQILLNEHTKTYKSAHWVLLIIAKY